MLSNELRNRRIQRHRSACAYVAGDNAVHLGLLDERRVVGQGITGGHEALVGLLVPVLRGDRTTGETGCISA